MHSALLRAIYICCAHENLLEYICVAAYVGVRYLIDEKLHLKNCRPALMLAVTVHSWPSQTDDPTVKEKRTRKLIKALRTLQKDLTFEGCKLSYLYHI